MLRLINGLLLILLIGGSLYVYPELPESIPRHFDIQGQPDRWGQRTLLSWLLLPIIGVASAALVWAVAWYAPRRPSIVNMPDRDKLLQLPPDRQRWVLQGLSTALYLTSAVQLVMFAMIQYGAYRAAVFGDGGRIRLAAIIIALAVMPPIGLSSIAFLQRRMDTAWREWRTKGV